MTGGGDQALSSRFERWRSSPGQAGIFVDFDGTLAPIVTDPDSSRPLPGVVAALAALAARYAVVAVVSGRPAAFLVEYLAAPGVLLSGQYGLETVRDGQVIEDPEASLWRPSVASLAARATAEAPPGVRVESKGLALTVHVRATPEHDGWAQSWVREAAAASGLVMHRARRSYELRPPLVMDKGQVVTRLSAGLQAACFLGDDLGDLPAFAALRVGVRSDEAPAELLAAADLLVDGPDGARQLLLALATPPGQLAKEEIEQ